MSFLTPAWKGENKEKGLKAVAKLREDDKLYQVVLEAPLPDVKRAAIDRIADDAVLLQIQKLQPAAFSSLGAKEYNLASIKKFAFERMKDERAITEAALLKKPEKPDYLDKIHDDALLCRLAKAYDLPAAFDRIRDDKTQIALAQERLRYVDRVRCKRGPDWELLLLDGDWPRDPRVENARAEILSWDPKHPAVNNFGIRLLQDYCRWNSKGLPPDVFGRLEQLNEQFAGIELWARIGMLGLFPPRALPKKNVVEYARQMILDGNRRGATVLMRHLQKELPPETIEAIETLRRSCSGQELWAQLGLLGLFPAEKSADYCRAMIDGGDWRGLDILINTVKNSPHSPEAAAAVRTIKELYRKAAGAQSAELPRFRALPEGSYGRHADFQSTVCGYSDHTDNGVQVHFDTAALSAP